MFGAVIYQLILYGKYINYNLENKIFNLNVFEPVNLAIEEMPSSSTPYIVAGVICSLLVVLFFSMAIYFKKRKLNFDPEKKPRRKKQRFE